MGLDSLVEENTSSTPHNYRKYGDHNFNETLEEWVNEFQNRFPIDVKINFVEVSPALNKNHAKTYVRHENNEQIIYIRVSENIIDKDDWYIRQILLHSMVNAYLMQIGANELGASHSIKKWLCGRVGCRINAVSMNSEEWKLIAEPFIEEDMRSNEPPL